jgi:ubiquitin-conjugating enzyme E2 D/E
LVFHFVFSDYFLLIIMPLIRRLTIHFNEIQKSPPPLCYAQPEDAMKDMTHWVGYIDGPQDTPYAGGRYHLTMDFPSDYPFKPPQVRFTTPVFHPNISATGEICLDILHSQWSPALTIRGLLISLCSLLTDPNPEHGLNKDALKLYQTNLKKYNETAREWTRKYASENSN